MVITDRDVYNTRQRCVHWGGGTRGLSGTLAEGTGCHMGGGAYRAAAEAAGALERAARGLAEELQGPERAEVVARDAAPQARRAVVAVRPRPLRLRNDVALARRARPLLGRRRLVATGLARRGVVVLVARALRPQGPQHVVERAEGAGERLRGDLRRAVGRRRCWSGLRGPGGALAGGLDLLEVLLGVAPDLGRRARRDALGDLLPLAAVDVEALEELVVLLGGPAARGLGHGLGVARARAGLGLAWGVRTRQRS